LYADLRTLCGHFVEAASQQAYEDAAFDGWASKVYGEDWADYYDYDVLYDEFCEWREMKNEEEW